MLRVYPVVNTATKEVLVFDTPEDVSDFLLYVAKGPYWEKAAPALLSAVEDGGENGHYLVSV